MSDSFSPEVSDRICAHMNDDHADAVLLYAQVFGAAPAATSARMLAIDATGMDLLTQTGTGDLPVRVMFDHELQNAEDAHHTLIAMLKQARSRASA
jgi:putative heme iron utilization protein